MPARHFDPALGDLQCLSKDQWLGHVRSVREDIELTLAGPELGPDPTLVTMAASVLQRLPDVRARSLHSVELYAAELGWFDDVETMDWEMIGLEFLDAQQPGRFNVVFYEGVKDVYGWWEVSWDGDVLRSVRRLDQ